MNSWLRDAMVVALLCGSHAAQAAPGERNGYAQIVLGDYASAEQIVNGERRLFPADPDLLLNLATIYRRTGRADQAGVLYRTVLKRPDVELDLPGEKVASAHMLAFLALRDMGAGSFALR